LNLNFLIILCNLLWGAWGIFDKKALEKSNQKDVLLILYCMFLPEFIVTAILTSIYLPNWHIVPELWLWSGLASVSSTVAMIGYTMALSRAEASFVLGITSGYPLVMQLIANLMLGEPLLPNRLLGSLLIGAGVVAIGQSNPTGDSPAHKGRSLTLFILIALAMFGWGIHGIFDKKCVNIAHPLEVLMARMFWDGLTLVGMFAYLRGIGHKVVWKSRRLWILCGCSAICLYVGFLSYLSAMTLSSASYVIVITGCYPLVMYFFALLFLKEKLNIVRLIGVVLIVGGGALVQLTQHS